MSSAIDLSPRARVVALVTVCALSVGPLGCGSGGGSANAGTAGTGTIEVPGGTELPPVTAPTGVGIVRFQGIVDRELQLHGDEWRALSVSGGRDSTQYALLKLVIDGVLSMYEATGELRYLETALEWCENMAQASFPVPSADGERGWARDDGTSSLPDELHGALALARTARLIAASPQLDARYGSRGAALALFADQFILSKWMLGRSFGSFATTWDWMLGVQDEPPGTLTGYLQGHQVLAASLAFNLFEAGRQDVQRGGQTWMDLGRDIAMLVDGRLVVQRDGSLLWDEGTYLWRNSTTGIYDTAHASKFATMITEFHEFARVFDDADVAGLGRTVTERIWNGRTDWPDPEALPPGAGSIWFVNYIDGQDALFADQLYRAGGPDHPHDGRPEAMSGMVYEGWCRLGRTEPEVQVACAALLDFIEATDDRVNAVRNRNGANGVGIVALAGHLARNLRNRTW